MDAGFVTLGLAEFALFWFAIKQYVDNVDMKRENIDLKRDNEHLKDKITELKEWIKESK